MSQIPDDGDSKEAEPDAVSPQPMDSKGEAIRSLRDAAIQRNAAVNKLHADYCSQVYDEIKKRMQRMPNRVTSATDLTNEVLFAFTRAIEAGQYPDLSDNDSIWCLLATMTNNKVIDQFRRLSGNPKRDYKTNPRTAFKEVGEMSLDDAKTEFRLLREGIEYHDELNERHEPEISDHVYNKLKKRLQELSEAFPVLMSIDSDQEDSPRSIGPKRPPEIGPDRLRTDSCLPSDGEGNQLGWADVPVSPAEYQRRLFELLDALEVEEYAEEKKQILIMWLDGFDDEQIAVKIGKSKRAVQLRKQAIADLAKKLFG